MSTRLIVPLPVVPPPPLWPPPPPPPPGPLAAAMPALTTARDATSASTARKRRMARVLRSGVNCRFSSGVIDPRLPLLEGIIGGRNLRLDKGVKWHRRRPSFARSPRANGDGRLITL